MRAIIIATGERAGFRFLGDRRPLGLLPVAGKPFLQHLVETLVLAGVREFDFVLSHLPEAVEACLGDGIRWGSRFCYHLAPDPRRPYRALRSIVRHNAMPFLLAREDSLLDVREALGGDGPHATAAWCAGHGEWSGWGVVHPSDIEHLATGEDAPAFGQSLVELCRSRGTASTLEPVLSAATPQSYIDSQALALTAGGPVALPLGGNEAAPGVRISRNVSLHPTAKITPPVYIGPNCRIGAGARIGPNAGIGENCVIDSRSRVANSVVLAGSYVGESLDLDHALVDHNRLVNVKLDTEVTLTDEFLLGRLTETGFRRWLARTGRRAAASMLLLAASPLLAVTALALKLFRRGPVLHYREAVRLPAEGQPEQWRTFRIPAFRSPSERGRRSLVLETLPGLAAAAGGHLALAGVEPRSREEVLALPPDWRSLYLRSKPGLITEAAVHCPASANADSIFAAEAYYAAVSGFSHDLRLLASYVGQSVAGRKPAASELPVE